MTPWVVLRSRNDMPLAAETLARLAEQSQPFTLLSLDNASHDGTREALARRTDRLVTIPEGGYVPGRVLNQGMALSEGDVVVFLNADCTPQGPHWLSRLLAGFDDASVAAVFGRQIPRPDCHPLFAKDTEDTYGDGSRQRVWRHCFSMAASAIRRSVWEQMPFDETLGYSEDIDWTWRARRGGLRIRYVADAVAMHSHNYTLRQFQRRMYGEGCAEAAIFDWSPWERSLVRYSLLPLLRQVLHDWRFCLRHGQAAAALRSPALRLAGAVGRRAGFHAGWRARRVREGGA